jgi:predicted phosphodiesterase
MPKKRKRTSEGGKLKKILIVSDAHHPYVDKKAWALLLKVGADIKPDVILTQGDFADFYSVSSHSKDPSRMTRFEDEIESVNKALDQLDALGAKEKHFIAGNHCDRLQRYLNDKAPELDGLVSVPQLFRLKKRGWKYTPYKDSVKIGKLNATHDVGTAGKTAVFSALSTFQHNIVIGHVHRVSFHVEGNATGEAHVGASFGWLGDKNSVDYMHRVKVNRDWAHGFGVAYLEPNGNVHIQPVVIVDYKCVVGGKLYKV